MLNQVSKNKMKKQIASIVIMSCVLLLLTGCMRQANPQNAGDNTVYKINKQSYINKKVMINYPEVAGLSDSEKQKKVNELIKAEALHMLSHYSEEQLDKLTLELNYEIKVQKPEILSIAYSGFRHLQASVYSPFFTTNIDMRDGTRLRIQDMVNIDHDFSEKIERGRYFPQSAQIPLQRVQAIVSENILQGLNTADYLGGIQNQYDIYVYFTNGFLGISVGLPRPYGHHVEIEIPYQDITNNVKKENTIWKNFISNDE